MNATLVAGQKSSTDADAKNRSFGALLGRALEETGISQGELANYIGVTHSIVSDWRTGKRAMRARDLLAAPPALRDWFSQLLRSRDQIGIVDHPALLAQTVRELGELMAEYTADLSDGKLDDRERIELLKHIRDARRVLQRVELACLDGEVV